MITCAACQEENPERARFCLSCGAALATPVAPPREIRKTVTILFSDVAGSTTMGEQLDPESMRRVMSRYFEAMQAVLERHGGVVEKFIGDAVMAVFGIPQLHEDDALRAVRAATEMRETLTRLNEELDHAWGIRIENRTGVNTGEVVAGSGGSGQTLVTGDPVNVAARLEQTARPGEILIGEETRRLVRDAVSVEAVDPLMLKGKSEAVPAHRLLSVQAGAPAFARHLDSPLVGRSRECLLLEQAFERSVAERRCHLFTILGSAGAGKSRLVEELIARLGSDATVLRGRCLPYGEAITFWPVREIVKQASGFDDTDTPEEAKEKIEQLLEGESDAPVITARVAEALGLAPGGGVQEEIFWGIRKLLESLARNRPLVVLLDDIHWADATFLDLINHIADWSRDSPILLLCPARLELLDQTPGWAGGKLNATSILLEPLSTEECGILITNLLGKAGLTTDLERRITDAAEGNPLFVEEMLRILIDDALLQRVNEHWEPSGDLSRVPVPPTIQALLAARLDRLENEERRVMECASVGGAIFYRGAVAELIPEAERATVGSRLMTLVRRELIRFDRSSFAGEDAFRFRHILIRDAAYEAMPKEQRAGLHERFALWLERAAGERAAEYEEIIGYHFEEAYRYRTDLGPADERAQGLARQAADRLGRAGRRALERSDLSAACDLLQRATALLSPSERRVELLLCLADALTGQDFRSSIEMAHKAQVEAERLGTERLIAHSHAVLLTLRLTAEAVIDLEALESEATDLLSALEGHGDDLGLARVWLALAYVSLLKAQCAPMEVRLRRALDHARLAGDRRAETDVNQWLCNLLYFGPTPVEEAAPRLQEFQREHAGSLAMEHRILGILGAFQVMTGRPEKAMELIGQAEAVAIDAGDQVSVGHIRGFMAGQSHLLCGDAERAERELRESYEIFEKAGAQGYQSSIAGLLADALCLQGSYSEAERFAAICAELAATGDVLAQLQWRIVRAKLLAQSGELAEAERLAREAAELADTTDTIDYKAWTYLGLADILQRKDQTSDARIAFQQAIDYYAAKGYLIPAHHARQLLEALPSS